MPSGHGASTPHGIVHLLASQVTVPAGGAGQSLAAMQSIWQVWLESGNGAINRLMQQGVLAMNAQDYGTALQTFTRIVDQAPEFAEGWNKRATVYYLMGNWRASVRDIRRTLALEPRHFGALSGLGLIYEELDQPEAALRSFEAALAIHPKLRGGEARLRDLRRRALGEDT